MTEAAPLRRAATLMLVQSDPLRVLMVRRGRVGAFAGALAFPGGVVDPEDADPAWLDVLDGAGGLAADERARRVAALRELYEETGIVLGRHDPVTPGAAGFLARCLELGVRSDVGSVLPVARWITPEGYPKRFDTWFYVASVLDPPDARVDGLEIASVEWVAPGRLVEEAARPERQVLLPTLANLRRLTDCGGDWSAWSAAFAAAPDPVCPVVRVREDGVRVASIPATAGYGALEFPIG